MSKEDSPVSTSFQENGFSLISISELIASSQALQLSTVLTFPSLQKAPDPKIINVSSDSHFHGKIHFEDVNLHNLYQGLPAYAQSKLANVLFTFEFQWNTDEQKAIPVDYIILP